MRRALKRRLENKHIGELQLTGPIRSLLDELKSLLGGLNGNLNRSKPPDAINVVGLEKSFADRREAAALLGRLNHERDLIRRHIPAVVLIWLPDFALDTLARGAPDFWAWRSGVYEIPSQVELPEQELLPAFSVFAENDAVWSLSLQKRQEEVARLEKLLEPTKDLPPEGQFRRQMAVVDRLESLAMLCYALGYLQRASQFYCHLQFIRSAVHLEPDIAFNSFSNPPFL
jgi:hypothetical protein